MNVFLAWLAVLACSGVAFTAGVARACARMIPALLRMGWTPPADQP